MINISTAALLLSLIPAPVPVNIEPIRHTLAPPPMGMVGVKEINLDGEKFFYVFDGVNAEIVKGDKEISYPIVIKPEHGDYWIKLTKGGPWISLKTLEDHLAFMKSVVAKFTGGSDPPDKGGNGNGNGDEDDEGDGPLPMLLVNDLVECITNPEWGVGIVREMRLFEEFAGMKAFWAARVEFVNGGDKAFEHFSKASNFKKVFPKQVAIFEAEPKYPFIIGPKPGKLYIKTMKGGRWFTVNLAGRNDELWYKNFPNYMSTDPPEGGNGNGGEPDYGMDPPFKVGDKVTHTIYAHYGVGVVTDVEQVKQTHGIPFWRVTAKFTPPGQMVIFTANASRFIKHEGPT